ncbi:hypothetical protein Bhyg_02285 [Pseudolycoriella hygida]|uniref:Uncharacterized protein n=1 Tax=Pseudolycoriella hygida TaxID=35572 RepID=A0A9Q0S8E5_9DIPT|nr:hypothetical protein Bhyg_02285 [Pseudolycoriella hygida]
MKSFIFALIFVVVFCFGHCRVVYDVDDFDVYEVEYDGVRKPKYEIVRETNVEVDYTRNTQKAKASKTTIQTK